MKQHKLTQAQAERLGVPHLSGEFVQVEMCVEGECPSDLVGKIAKNVYYNASRIGGILDLGE